MAAYKKLTLTRDQLAKFLTDQQQIRQFELLFSTVDELQIITGIDFLYQADTAAATANNALAQISSLAQKLELLALAPVPNNAEQDFDLLALAPVRNNIELAHDVSGILPYANQTASVRSNQVLTWVSM